MIDTNVGTYHGLSSLSRMGGLLVDGYYFDKPSYEGRVPLLLSLHGNHFAWIVGYGPTCWDYDESSWADGVMELLDRRMGKMVPWIAFHDQWDWDDGWDSEPDFLRWIVLYCYKTIDGGEVFFFYDQWRSSDLQAIVRGWLENMLDALQIGLAEPLGSCPWGYPPGIWGWRVAPRACSIAR